MSITEQKQEAEQSGKIYANFWSANRLRAVRISQTVEFSTPITLATIPYPDGIAEYLDLPQSFIDDCYAQAEKMAQMEAA